MNRRAHIAMVGTPTVSHVLPSLEVIRELVDRGHRVTYANDPLLADTITGVGAELVPYSTILPTGDGTWPDDPVKGMDIFLDEAINQLPALRAAYDGDRPDLFLYDISGFAARVLSVNWDIPSVQLSPTYVAWADYEDTVLKWLRAQPGAEEHYAKLDAWLADNGVTGLDHSSFAGVPERALALIPREMQPFADTVAETVTFVGPCLGDRADQGEWTRPADADNVLLVSLGSAFTNQPGFYRACLEAFGDLPGWHVVLQIGKYVDPAELGEVPGNVEVHTWVPQLAVLRQADAFVTHAGMGGSSEGLYTGVPMIAVPQAVDQFDNADRLVELGVARRIDTGEASAERLRSALLELTADPGVARRLAEVSARLQASGTSYAADLVEAELPA
ncbi:glycosyl transferase [Nocardiopsis dassonvillei]|uniref:Glycosyltransferase, MGT family n=2 Tax=Nocardiopsidaceae TaxID=83676 RepID=D7AX27_NOCDD|nr:MULTISPECIES: macrolide family glycosyltransferase [Nocardiopsis]ADH69797.1 glycosyltransferase, MGT family [Nocardiopsis dassonvillei subsp. dassonvillei DSM 43111]APC37796.1 glycosyl transferase [Nocardiopsis dassonvillei]NKY80191.1 glycosyl transferase [Nocardiopsis dassonvillei]VEI90309.1 Oleandomycin glycosyltransferase [Nocardiopsis dassonvillei]